MEMQTSPDREKNNTHTIRTILSFLSASLNHKVLRNLECPVFFHMNYMSLNIFLYFSINIFMVMYTYKITLIVFRPLNFFRSLKNQNKEDIIYLILINSALILFGVPRSLCIYNLSAHP